MPAWLARSGAGDRRDMTEQCTSTRVAVYLLSGCALDRAAYRRLLIKDLDLHVVADTDYRPASIWTGLRRDPEVILAHADVIGPRVIDALQMIGHLRPTLGIIAVSAAHERRELEPWGRCPLRGYVKKQGGLEELRTAILAVLAGREYFSPGTRNAIMRGAAGARHEGGLSRREADLLPLLARGLTLRQAALEMAISYKTADSYRSNLLRKLGIRDRVGLARYAVREGLIDA